MDFGPFGNCDMFYKNKRPFLRMNLLGLQSGEDHCIVDESGNYLAVFTTDSNGGCHETMSITNRAGFSLKDTVAQLERYGQTIASGTFE